MYVWVYVYVSLYICFCSFFSELCVCVCMCVCVCVCVCAWALVDGYEREAEKYQSNRSSRIELSKEQELLRWMPRGGGGGMRVGWLGTSLQLSNGREILESLCRFDGAVGLSGAKRRRCLINKEIGNVQVDTVCVCVCVCGRVTGWRWRYNMSVAWKGGWFACELNINGQYFTRDDYQKVCHGRFIRNRRMWVSRRRRKW